MHDNEENELLKKFAAFMKEKRQALGISTYGLSEIIYGNDKKAGFLTGIETGRRKGLTIDIMNKILKALNSDINFIEH